jgi:Alternative complex III, ActD subunit
MREPTADSASFGLLAEFDDPERLLASARKAHEAGFRSMDAYSPFPIDDLAEALGFNDIRVPMLALTGGIFGAALSYGMQIYANLNYPIDIGARPLIAMPAFTFVAIGLTMLFAVLFAIGGMLVLNHLPRLNHPLFDVEAFHLASSDKFFLVIFSNDAQFDAEATRDFLETLQPVSVALVGHSEEPE